MHRSITSNPLLALLLATVASSVANAKAPLAAVRSEDEKLRAITYNIYNRPWEREGRFKNLAELLEAQHADIIDLQEVATGWILRGSDPAQRLAERLHMHFVRYWHEENLGIFRTGIAVLSKYPIVRSEYHEFARHDFWDAKGYMLVVLRLPSGRTLQLINLHMASTSNAEIRLSEWQELARFASALQANGPVLISGDFNTEPTDPALLGFVAQSGVRSLYDGWKNVAQMRSWTPDYRDSCDQNRDSASQLIDYFFALPGSSTSPGSIQFESGRILMPGPAPHPSDHCGIAAELVLK